MGLEHQPDDGHVQLAISRNDSSSRYEGRVGDEMVGEVDFSMRDSTMIITHTGTRPAWRGRGIAGQLNGFVLADIRDRGLSVQPVCPYTADYIAQHPQYADLVV